MKKRLAIVVALWIAAGLFTRLFLFGHCHSGSEAFVTFLTSIFIFPWVLPCGFAGFVSHPFELPVIVLAYATMLPLSVAAVWSNKAKVYVTLMALLAMFLAASVYGVIFVTFASC